MANPDCEACVTSYGSSYNGPLGPAREPFGGCTDCRSFACSHHGHRRSQGGFICIRCDPAALVGSAAQQVAASPSIEEDEQDGTGANAARQIRNVLVRYAAQNRPTEAWAYAEIADWYEVIPRTRELRSRGIIFDDSDRDIFRWSADPDDIDRAVARVSSMLGFPSNVMVGRLEEVIIRRGAGLRQVGLDPRYVELADGLRSLWRMAPRTARELMAAGLTIIPPTVNRRELPVALDLLATVVGELR